MAFNWIKFPWTNLHELNLDWIIQTVKTLENNLADAVSTFQKMINEASSKTLTGSGDLTINKTGDVRISGNSVQLSKTVMSSGSEQLTLHNTTSNTSMGANYNSGTLALTNNQNGAAGVAVYPVNTPADGGGDNSDFAANVGYVKTAVNAVSGQLDTESRSRASGDAALQSTIDNVVMPLIGALQKRAPKVFYFSTTAEAGTLTADEVSTIKTALIDHTPIMFVAYNAPNQYCYYLNQCIPQPTTENIDTDAFNPTFRTLDGLYSASLTFSGSGGSGTVIFDTIS